MGQARGLVTLTAVAALGACLGATAPARAATPTDPGFANEWALAPGGPLDAAAAWRYGDGSGATVAVLDTGVNVNHPDLRGALWTNPGEIPGNGIDDDHDGIVDDVHGANLVDHTGDPSDVDGHGTHVAGIIAAQRDGEGVVGLAPGAKVMPVRVLSAGGTGTTDNVAAGIRYAVAHGASIINTSFNGDGDDPDMNAAIAAARDAGVLIVASAGNSTQDLDASPSWPASDASPNVVPVAATDENGLLASFSSFGRRTVALAAPGVDILSTAMDGGLEERSGTSMSAPEVSAALALLHAARPDMPGTQLVAALEQTARRPAGLASVLAAGEIDPAAALAAIGAPIVQASSAPVVTARVARRARHGARTLVTWKVTGDSTGVASFKLSGAGGRRLAVAKAAKRGVWLKVRSGRVRVTARNAAGAAVAATTVTIKR